MEKLIAPQQKESHWIAKWMAAGKIHNFQAMHSFSSQNDKPIENQGPSC